jgi:hypothetical protein
MFGAYNDRESAITYRYLGRILYYYLYFVSRLLLLLLFDSSFIFCFVLPGRGVTADTAFAGRDRPW